MKYTKPNKIHKLTNSLLLRKSQLKILSWNIQSSKTGLINKFDDLSFTSIFSGHDIVCLQEIRQAVQLPGYRSLCNLRPGAKHGGVGILYKNELLGGIDLINKYKIQDVIICKLKKTFFNLNQDIYIVNSYITPSNSSVSKTIIDGRELFHKIETIVILINYWIVVKFLYDVLTVMQEFLTTPALLNTKMKILMSTYHYIPDDYIPDSFTNRCTQDRQTNTVIRTERTFYL